MKQDTKTNTNTNNETPKKYELTDESIDSCGVKLFRIRALRDLFMVKAGNLGGFIQSEDNLSHEGNAWVGDEARVFGKAQVRENALVTSHACVCDHAQISGDAVVKESASVCGHAQVFEDAMIEQYAHLYDNVMIYGDALLGGVVHIAGDAQVYGESYLLGNAFVSGNADINEDRAVLVIDNLGDNGEIITAYKQRDNSIGVTYRDYNGYCETFENLSQFEVYINKGVGAEFKEEYLAAINLIKIRFNQHTD